MKTNKIKIMMYGLVIVAVVTANVFISNGILAPSTETKPESAMVEHSHSPGAAINVVVFDNVTLEPIEDAVLYLGVVYSGDGDAGIAHTDSNGHAWFDDLSPGSYCLFVCKKGYQRYFLSCTAQAGNGTYLVGLTKQPETPIQITVEGTLLEIIKAPGTRSEEHYYVIRIDGTDQEEYIFNEVGWNYVYRSFSAYVNTTVCIKGYMGLGTTGTWYFQDVNGIYIEEITTI